MIVLAVINIDDYEIVYIELKSEYFGLARLLHNSTLQTPADGANTTLFNLLGGEIGFEVSPELGTVIDNPVGATKVYHFWYN